MHLRHLYLKPRASGLANSFFIAPAAQPEARTESMQVCCSTDAISNITRFCQPGAPLSEAGVQLATCGDVSK